MVGSGLMFFMRKHTLKFLVVIAVIFGAPGYIVIDWYTTDRATVKEAEPIGATFSLMPEAFAGERGVPIKINGSFYGMADTTVTIYKLTGEARFLVHDHVTGQVTSVSIPSARKFAK